MAKRIATRPWVEFATCVPWRIPKGQHPDWFPANRQAGRNVRVEPGLAEAKAICVTCPVRNECLEFALQRRDDGVWGGLTESERVKVRRRRAKAAEP